MRTLRSPVDQAIRKLLKRARKAAGLSQGALAAKVRCRQPLISEIEKTNRYIDVSEFVTLAKALGQNPLEMLADAIAEAEQPRGTGASSATAPRKSGATQRKSTRKRAKPR